MNVIAKKIVDKIIPYCNKIEHAVQQLTITSSGHAAGSSCDAAILLKPKLSFIKNLYIVIYENIAILDHCRFDDNHISKYTDEFFKIRDSVLDVDDDVVINMDLIHDIFIACVKYTDIEFALFVTSVKYDNTISNDIRDSFDDDIVSLFQYLDIHEPSSKDQISKNIERNIIQLIKDVELNIHPTHGDRKECIFSAYTQITNIHNSQFYEQKYIINYLYFNFCRHIATSIKFNHKFTPNSSFLFAW